MAAARSRLAIALAALGIAFAACLGGDHGAARAAVGNATGPLIGSPLAGAAILTASGMAPGRRAHRLHRRDQHRRHVRHLRPRLDRADVGAPLAQRARPRRRGRHPGAHRRGRVLRQAGVAFERRAGRHGPGRGAPLPLQRQPPADADDSYPGRLERGHLPVVGHGAPSPPRTPTGATPARRRTAGGTGTTTPAPRHDGRGPAKATRPAARSSSGATVTARGTPEGHGRPGQPPPSPAPPPAASP